MANWVTWNWSLKMGSEVSSEYQARRNIYVQWGFVPHYFLADTVTLLKQGPVGAGYAHQIEWDKEDLQR